MPVPSELRAVADMLAIQENARNGHQITSSASPWQGSGSAPRPVGLALPIGTMWQTGRTLRVKILNGSDRIKQKIQQYAMIWTEHANIHFAFVESGDAEIRVNVDASRASWSYIGTDNLSVPASEQTMNFGSLKDDSPEHEFARVITHEFGHALGCIHEHQSPVAGIVWNRDLLYRYYKQVYNWSTEKVNTNVIDVAAVDTTQFTVFDPKSIMIYAIPGGLTLNGYHTDGNTQLSDSDKAFIAQVYPHPTGQARASVTYGSFNTMEKRPWTYPQKTASKEMSFPHAYQTPPTVAVGLSWLDIANEDDIRVKAYVDSVTGTALAVRLDTWAGTKLYSGGCTLYATPTESDFDIQAGQFSTLDDHPAETPQMKTVRKIAFARPFEAPPEVVLDVSATGFTLNIETWDDSVLYMAAVSWIAHRSEMPGFVSGSYNTSDVRQWQNPQSLNSGKVDFPAGVLQRTPKVLLAFNYLDIDKKSNLRLKLSADSVSQTGMNWHIDSWADTVLYAAGASYIAFG